MQTILTDAQAASQPTTYIKLSGQQRLKCVEYMEFYDEPRSVQLTLLTHGAGENSLNTIRGKIFVLKNTQDPKLVEFHKKLDTHFELNVPYPIGTIISDVLQIRRDVGLPLPTHKLSQSCLSDFSLLFVADPTIEDIATKKKDGTIGTKAVKSEYTPRFKLMP